MSSSMSLFQSQQSVDESQKLTKTGSSILDKPETETPLETSGKDSESEYNTADEETESQVQVRVFFIRNCLIPGPPECLGMFGLVLTEFQFSFF